MLPVMFAMDVPAGPASALPLTIRLVPRIPWACTSGTAASSIVTHTGQPWNLAADKFSFDWIIESSPPEAVCAAGGFFCPGKHVACVIFRTFAGHRHRPLPNIHDMGRGNLRRHKCTRCIFGLPKRESDLGGEKGGAGRR